MVSDERSLTQLRLKLDEVLGPERAATLMNALPPGPPATRFDLEGLEQRMEQRMDERFAAFEQRMEQRMDERFADFEQRMDMKLEILENRLLAALHESIGLVRADFSSQLAAQTRVFFFSTISAMITLSAVLVATVQLA